MQQVLMVRAHLNKCQGGRQTNDGASSASQPSARSRQGTVRRPLRSPTTPSTVVLLTLAVPKLTLDTVKLEEAAALGESQAKRLPG